MPLRNFLFLDTKAVGDYLSALEGYIVEGPIDQTETGKKDRSGRLGARISTLGGEVNASSANSIETKQKLAVTDAAQFERLYGLLEDQEDAGEGIQLLDAFDDAIWQQLRRGEILEIEAKIQVAPSYLLIQASNEFDSLLTILASAGQNNLADESTVKMISGFKALGTLTENKPIPLVFEPISTPGYSFLANLTRQFLRCDLVELEGEASVFGKIRRIIPRGQQQEAFSIMPAFASRLSNRNQQQMQEMQRKLVETGGADVIAGPAIVMTPIAIYR